MIVDLHWTYTSLCLVHLIIDIYHLTSILRKRIVKWIVVLPNPITCGVLCSAIYVYLIIIHSTFVLWLLYLLLLHSLVVLVLWYNTFTLILYLLLVHPLNHIFIRFLRTFPRLALRLKIYGLIHIITIVLLLYWSTLSTPIVVNLLKLLLIYWFWIIMLLNMIRLILIELSFWRKNIISIFFILIENTLLLLLLWNCSIIIFLYKYLVWSWIVLIHSIVLYLIAVAL